MVGIHCTHKQTTKHVRRLLLGRELLKEVIPLKQAPIGPCGIHNLNYFLNLVNLSVPFLEIWYENTKIYTLKNLSLQALVSIWFRVQHLLWWEHPPLLQHHCPISITIFRILSLWIIRLCNCISESLMSATCTPYPHAVLFQLFLLLLFIYSLSLSSFLQTERNFAFHHVSSFCIANHELAA